MRGRAIQERWAAETYRSLNEMAVNGVRGATTLVYGPHDQGLAPTAVARGKDTLDRRTVVVVPAKAVAKVRSRGSQRSHAGSRVGRTLRARCSSGRFRDEDYQ